MKKFLVLSLFLLNYAGIYAQEYFQQEVNFSIKVSLDDERHILNANEEIEYINNSPDTLHFLYFHLWPNAYSSNSTFLARQLKQLYGKEKYFRDKASRGYIDSMDFSSEGILLNWEVLHDTADICKIALHGPLQPGDTVFISTPFRVKLPLGVTSRLGHIGQSYQVSQWFPKPAVYDSNGWHQMPYLDQGEFYSEFGQYLVQMTLPANYRVGASGDLLTNSERLWLDSLASDTVKDRKRLFGEHEFPMSSPQRKTLIFRGENIHDFAWFADKRFYVKRDSIHVPGKSSKVLVMTLYTDFQEELWDKSLDYCKMTLLKYSEWIGSYPYNSFVAVQSALAAGSGMEYPGLTVIGETYDDYTLDEVLTHEIGHNWFYSALGSNERRYPYMDESLAAAYEVRYLREKYPGKKLWPGYFDAGWKAKLLDIEELNVHKTDEYEWYILARRNREQALNLPAPEYSLMNYNILIYNKGYFAFEYLRSFLGDSLFDATMSAYYTEWTFRHPSPGDLRDLFLYHTGDSLNWFFDDMLGTTKRIDYKILDLKNNQLLLKNRGELASPVLVTGLQNDSTCFTYWVDGFKKRKAVKLPGKNFTEIILNHDITLPESERLNNNIKREGIFKKDEPLRFRFLFTLDDNRTRSLMYLPVLNWNSEDGLMPGLAFYNSFIVPKKNNFFVMPFYSFKKNDFSILGRLSSNILPANNTIRTATLDLGILKFGAPAGQSYFKFDVGLSLYFRNEGFSRDVSNKVFTEYILESDFGNIRSGKAADPVSYIRMGYELKRESPAHPYKIFSTLEYFDKNAKVSMGVKYRHSYYGKDTGLDIELFSGFLLKDSPERPYHGFASSARTGSEEYFYRGFFPERFSSNNNALWSRFMQPGEGALVSHINDTLGFNKWLTSLTFSSTLPGFLRNVPVKPFLTFLVSSESISTGLTAPVMYEGGVKVGYWDFFEIHFPLLVSEGIRNIRGGLDENIRILFNLEYIEKIRLNRKY